MSKLRVLVVDDSAYNRQIISEILISSPEIEVVGKAEDGEQALKLVASLRPDLITLDIEMPRMDGFTFLRLLMSQMATPVIVISSHSRKQEVFQALELGALDFIAKPTRFFSPEMQGLKEELLEKAMAVRSLQIIPFTKRNVRTEFSAITPIEEKEPPIRPPPAATAKVRLERVICIGASTGGPPAVQSLLKALSSGTPSSLVIAQHMPEKFTRAFADRLNRISNMAVQEAQDGMLLHVDNAYIAPGGTHTELVENKDGSISIKLVGVTNEDRYVPSIDRLFKSLAKLNQFKKMAVVLTGMGADGSLGIRDVHAAGGRILAESQDTAIVFGMPKEAIQTNCVHEILPLEGLIERIHRFTTMPS